MEWEEKQNFEENKEIIECKRRKKKNLVFGSERSMLDQTIMYWNRKKMKNDK